MAITPQEYMQKLAQATGMTVGTEPDTAFFDANTAYISALQTRLNELSTELALRKHPDHAFKNGNMQRGYEALTPDFAPRLLPVTGQWTPEWRSYVEKLSEALPSDIQEHSQIYALKLRDYRRGAVGTDTNAVAAFGSILTRSSSSTWDQLPEDDHYRALLRDSEEDRAYAKKWSQERSGNLRDLSRFADNLRTMTDSATESLQAHDAMQSAMPPLVRMKETLNGLDAYTPQNAYHLRLNNLNLMRYLSDHTDVKKDDIYSQNKSFAAPLNTQADDWRFGFGLMSARTQAQEFLNRPEIRRHTGLAAMPVTGDDTSAMRAALQTLEEKFGPDFAAALDSPNAADVQAFWSQYKKLDPNDIVAADKALTAQTLRFIDLYAKGHAYEATLDTERNFPDLPTIPVSKAQGWNGSAYQSAQTLVDFLGDEKATQPYLQGAFKNIPASKDDKEFAVLYAPLFADVLAHRNTAYDGIRSQRAQAELAEHIGIFGLEQLNGQVLPESIDLIKDAAMLDLVRRQRQAEWDQAYPNGGPVPAFDMNNDTRLVIDEIIARLPENDRDVLQLAERYNLSLADAQNLQSVKLSFMTMAPEVQKSIFPAPYLSGRPLNDLQPDFKTQEALLAHGLIAVNRADQKGYLGPDLADLKARIDALPQSVRDAITSAPRETLLRETAWLQKEGGEQIRVLGVPDEVYERPPVIAREINPAFVRSYVSAISGFQQDIQTHGGVLKNVIGGEDAKIPQDIREGILQFNRKLDTTRFHVTGNLTGRSNDPTFEFAELAHALHTKNLITGTGLRDLKSLGEQAHRIIAINEAIAALPPEQKTAFQASVREELARQSGPGVMEMVAFINANRESINAGLSAQDQIEQPLPESLDNFRDPAFLRALSVTKRGLGLNPDSDLEREYAALYGRTIAPIADYVSAYQVGYAAQGDDFKPESDEAALASQTRIAQENLLATILNHPLVPADHRTSTPEAATLAALSSPDVLSALAVQPSAIPQGLMQKFGAGSTIVSDFSKLQSEALANGLPQDAANLSALQSANYAQIGRVLVTISAPSFADQAFPKEFRTPELNTLLEAVNMQSAILALQIAKGTQLTESEIAQLEKLSLGEIEKQTERSLSSLSEDQAVSRRADIEIAQAMNAYGILQQITAPGLQLSSAERQAAESLTMAVDQYAGHFTDIYGLNIFSQRAALSQQSPEQARTAIAADPQALGMMAALVRSAANENNETLEAANQLVSSLELYKQPKSDLLVDEWAALDTANPQISPQNAGAENVNTVDTNAVATNSADNNSTDNNPANANITDTNSADTSAATETYKPNGLETHAYPDVTRERIHTFQTVSNLADVGTLDQKTQVALSAYLSNALSDYLAQGGPATIQLEGGGAYKISPQGDILFVNDQNPGGIAKGNIRDVGANNDVNYAAFLVLDSMLRQDQTVSDLHTLKVSSLKKPVLDQLQSEFGIDAAQAETLGIFEAKGREDVRNILKPIVEKQSYTGHFDASTHRIWTQIMALQAFEANPNYQEVVDRPAHFADFNMLAAARDIMAYATFGEAVNTLDEIDIDVPADLPDSDKVFFEKGVYSQLKQYGQCDGFRIDPKYEGYVLTRDQVAEIALQKMIERAAEHGIAQKDITKAMFEGRFNPHFDDLQLALEGLGKPDYNDIVRDYPDVLRTLEDAKIIQPGDMPPESYLQGVYAAHSSKIWNERFGSISDIGTIETRRNDTIATMNGNDLTLRLLMRREPGDFEKKFGLPRDPDLTYADAMRLLNDPQKRAGFNKAMAQTAQTAAPYYFDNSSNDPASGFNLRRDYQELRMRSYLPDLKDRRDDEIRAKHFILPESETAPQASTDLGPAPAMAPEALENKISDMRLAAMEITEPEASPAAAETSAIAPARKLAMTLGATA